MKNILRNAVLCSAFLAATATGHAVIVINDQFNDGDRADGADPLDSEWYLLTNIAPTTAAVVGGALTLERNTSTAVGFNPHAVTTFSPQTLGIGDTITLSFDFQSLGGANASGVRFGLYNSGGTPLETDIASNPPATGAIFQNDLGYSVFAPHQLTGTVSLFYRPVNATNNTLQLAAGANSTVVGTVALGTATNTATVYAASLAISRLTSTDFNVAVTYAGASFNQNYTPATLTNTFDSLSIFGITAQNQRFTLDDVRVEVVPEPSAIAFSALGLLALTRPRRR